MEEEKQTTQELTYPSYQEIGNNLVAKAKETAKQILYANDPNIRMVDILETRRLYFLSNLNFTQVNLVENGKFVDKFDKKVKK